MKRFFVYLLLSLLLVSCNKPERKRNFICFLDLSKSVDDQKFNEYTQILVKDIYQNMGVNDQIRIYPLDYASRIKNDPIFYEDLAAVNLDGKVRTTSHHESEVRKLIHDHTTGFTDSLASIILKFRADRSNFAFETDILGALEKVYRERIDQEPPSGWDSFKGYVNGDRTYEVKNYVVLFSDMIHNGGGTNFNHLNTTAKADQWLKEIQEGKGVPDMEKMHVYVNGITAANNKSLDAIEYFWKGYFKLSKATVSCLNYNCGYNISKDLRLQE